MSIGNDKLFISFSLNGAELQSIRHLPTNTEYLWQGDSKYWAGRSPNMFPVNVKFRDGGRYTYKDVSYVMPSLGVVKNAAFHVVGSNSQNKLTSNIVLALNSSEQTLLVYPFQFRLEIAAEVKDLTLSQTYTVINTGREPLYFALGSHPGFRAPLNHGRDRSDYELRFVKNLQIMREEVKGGLVTGKRITFLNNEDRFVLDDKRVPKAGMLLWNLESRRLVSHFLDETHT